MTGAPAPALSPLLGVNLPVVNDYTQTPMYVDLMRHARRFGRPQTPWDEAAELDAQGWPRGDFGIVLMVGQRQVPESTGVYTVRFKGRALVEAVASDADIRNPRYDPATQRSQVEVVLYPGADQLMLSFTRTGNGVQDLQVLRPGYNPDAPPLFTRAFLQHLAGFQTLRFMDWTQTNGSKVKTWAQRSDPHVDHTATARGVPWEHVIELANTLHSDPWINVPIDADDQYVRELAQLLRRALDPRLHVYVEYSNEIWNASFAQYHQNLKHAQELLHKGGDSPLLRDGEHDVNRIAYKRIAWRLMEIAQIFRQVYGEAAVPQHIRPVLAGQVVQPSILQLQLEFIARQLGPPAQHLYAIAGAPYFNLGPQQTAEGLTIDEVLHAMGASIEQLGANNALEQNMALARWHGLPLLAYEGGSDTFGPGSLAAKREASLDPRMLGLCQRYLDSWFAQGGGLLMWYSAGAGLWDHRFGSWELVPTLNDRQAPKFRCLQGYTPRPMRLAPDARNRVPGVVAAMDFVGSVKPYSAEALRQLRYLHPGQALDYLIQVGASGSYTLRLRAEAGQPGNSLSLALDGQPLENDLVLPRSGWGALADTRALRLNLSAGLHTLRLRTRNETTGFRLESLLFEAAGANSQIDHNSRAPGP